MKLSHPVFYCLFLALLPCLQTVAQKSYSLNKMMEFETEDSPGSKLITDYFLIDSLNTGHKLQLFESSEVGKLRISFRDFRGSSFRTIMSKTAFEKAEKITADCEGVIKSVKLDKIKDARFMQDSVIDGVVCKQYNYSLKVKRNGKNVKRYYHVWIEVRDNTDNPVFVNLGESSEHDMPRGLVRYSFCTYDGDPHKYRVVRYKGSTVVNKTVVIPAACDYSK